ncbi:lipopolysaccharide transport periplasmic protein LptA [Sulfitobacter sp. 1151]|uniref:Lipopolysaccharide transport periplasmic protein LptA n=2 Tax=Parasulfitobacter algicola TaxID=2614809 RepID=A0ABX2IKF8_9RHOB|nr:lipopolysaccharide transport periplasmic protein LptA [Sulfitobacter algicola]
MALPAFAQQLDFGGMQQDPNAPVEVVADQLGVNQTDGSATFTGNVLISQGEMRLSAAKVVVVYTEETSDIQSMKASGGVTLLNGPEAAEAAEADYTIESGMIIMRGNVLVTQGANTVSADRMTVNLTTGMAQMEGRVRTVLGGQN